MRVEIKQTHVWINQKRTWLKIWETKWATISKHWNGHVTVPITTETLFHCCCYFSSLIFFQFEALVEYLLNCSFAKKEEQRKIRLVDDIQFDLPSRRCLSIVGWCFKTNGRTKRLYKICEPPFSPGVMSQIRKRHLINQ